MPEEQGQLMLITILLVIVFLLIAVTAILKAGDSGKPSGKGKAGEDRVSFILHSLPQEYFVIDDVIIPDQGSGNNRNITTQIDHVVVSPFGIFVIETKNYSGWIFGSEDSKQWKQSFKTTKGHFFYNPIKQNWGHTYALAERLHLRTGLFKPIVVFLDDCELHVESTTPVIYLSQLKQLILEYTEEILSREHVAWIYNRLNELDLDGVEYEKNHIQSIEDRFIDREMKLQKGICPRCGGELKLRNGKYGRFYGCSNYPRCRFTYDAENEC